MSLSFGEYHGVGCHLMLRTVMNSAELGYDCQSCIKVEKGTCRWRCDRAILATICQSDPRSVSAELR
jgi:hypothetical protein